MWPSADLEVTIDETKSSNAIKCRNVCYFVRSEIFKLMSSDNHLARLSSLEGFVYATLYFFKDFVPNDKRLTRLNSFRELEDRGIGYWHIGAMQLN